MKVLKHRLSTAHELLRYQVAIDKGDCRADNLY